jgi:hypothetical protein
MNRPRRRRHNGRWYEIRVRGHMDHRWTAWLNGVDILQVRDGTTVLHGCVADQAALHSVLERLHDIGLPLVSVTQVDPTCATTTSSARRAPRSAADDDAGVPPAVVSVRTRVRPRVAS